MPNEETVLIKLQKNLINTTKKTKTNITVVENKKAFLNEKNVGLVFL